jgi:hypothetical protein
MKWEHFYEKLSEIIIDARKLRTIAVFALFCAVLYVWAFIAGANRASTATNLKILGAVGEVSGIMLSAITTVIVLKVMTVQGYFVDAILDIMMGDKGIEIMSKERRISLWQRLTRIIYVPVLDDRIKRNPTDIGLRKFDESLSKAIGTVFKYDKTFYIDRINVVITVEWSDVAEKKLIIMTTNLDFTLIPFDPSTPIEWKTYRKADFGLSIDDYESTAEPLILLDSQSPTAKITSFPGVKTGTREETKHSLSGDEKYDLKWKRLNKWKIDIDPRYTGVSSYVVLSGDVMIQNRCEGLKVLFTELGGEDLFIPIGQNNRWVLSGHDLRKRHKGVMVPDQGFELIFIRE